MAVGKFKKDTKDHVYRFDKSDILNAFKIMGNEYRMNILLVLSEYPDLTLEQINQQVGGDFKNIAAHTKKIFTAHLIYKTYKGKHVQHRLSHYGEIALNAYALFTKDPYR